MNREEMLEKFFKGEIVLTCDSKEIAKELMGECRKRSIEWVSGERCTEESLRCSFGKDNYFAIRGSGLTFGSLKRCRYDINHRFKFKTKGKKEMNKETILKQIESKELELKALKEELNKVKEKESLKARRKEELELMNEIWEYAFENDYLANEENIKIYNSKWYIEIDMQDEEIKVDYDTVYVEIGKIYFKNRYAAEKVLEEFEGKLKKLYNLK